MTSTVARSAMFTLLTLGLAAAPAQAQTISPDPAPMPAAEGVATYAPAPASDGVALSIGRGMSLVHWGPLSKLNSEFRENPALDAPEANLRLGYRMNNIVAFGTLAYDRQSRTAAKGHCIEEDAGFELGCKTWQAVDFTASLLTLGAGARYLFAPPAANLTTAYAVAGLAVSIPGAAHTDPDKKESVDKSMEGTVGFGFHLGGGAEYFVSEGFSLSGEAGLAFHTMGWQGGDQSQSALSIYSALFLNFYL